MAGGRPTDWTPTLGDEILNLMASGLSLAASAAELGVHRQRVYEWMEKHPEFADTVKLAQAKRQLFLERRLLTADVGPVVTSTIFALKNAGPEDWREKTEVDVNANHTHKIAASELSDDELARIAAGSGMGTSEKAQGETKPR